MARGFKPHLGQSECQLRNMSFRRRRNFCHSHGKQFILPTQRISRNLFFFYVSWSRPKRIPESQFKAEGSGRSRAEYFTGQFSHTKLPPKLKDQQNKRSIFNAFSRRRTCLGKIPYFSSRKQEIVFLFCCGFGNCYQIQVICPSIELYYKWTNFLSDFFKI